MNQCPQLSRHELELLSARFDIQDLESIKILTGGSENTNFLISTSTEKYVLTICEQKSQQNAKELAQFLEYLNKNKFNTSKIVHSSEGEPVVSFNEKPVMMKHFLEGENERDLSSPLLHSVGVELARLHQIQAPKYLPKQLWYGIEQFEQVKNYAANSPFDSWLSRVGEYIIPYLKLDLPKSIIHSDLFWDNIIVNGDTVTFMDFEEATYYYRVFDIGMAIIGLCADEEIINLVKAKNLLKGYRSEIQLLNIEITSLKAFTIYAGAAMTFWRHQNFNHTKPDPEMFDHYLGLKVLVDYLLSQPDDCFMEAIK